MHLLMSEEEPLTAAALVASATPGQVPTLPSVGPMAHQALADAYDSVRNQGAPVLVQRREEGLAQKSLVVRTGALGESGRSQRVPTYFGITCIFTEMPMPFASLDMSLPPLVVAPCRSLDSSTACRLSLCLHAGPMAAASAKAIALLPLLMELGVARQEEQPPKREDVSHAISVGIRNVNALMVVAQGLGQGTEPSVPCAWVCALRQVHDALGLARIALPTTAEQWSAHMPGSWELWRQQRKPGSSQGQHSSARRRQTLNMQHASACREVGGSSAEAALYTELQQLHGTDYARMAIDWNARLAVVRAGCA